MQYEHPPLVMTRTAISDDRKTITLADLPDPQPAHPLRLRETTPLIERLWRIALADIEANIVETRDGRYLGAGKSFGATVYTRDISYAGLLGVNHLYADLMLNSLKVTRDVRWRQGFRVARGYAVEEINAPWEEEELSESEYLEIYHTNSYTRRTDDVVWLSCAAELLDIKDEPEAWQWFYDTGKAFFERFYQPFYDPGDGLFRGQASFVDIHFLEHKATGYPQSWDVTDCVLAKALSTNCLYVLGMEAMATAAEALALPDKADAWADQAGELRQAIRANLRRSDGTYAYLKEPDGALQPRRDALGTALVVLAGVVDGEEADRALGGYPITDAGAPLFHPFFAEDLWYHNHSAWPFVDTFLIRALEKNEGRDRTPLNAALLARTCVDDGTFHEVVDFRTKEVRGSGSQLWSAAAFVDVCRRAGLVRFPKEAVQ